jgi:long-chain acyl-CoA synthetase
MPSQIYSAPPDTGVSVLGRTLPSLLYEACERYANPAALNQPDGEGWRPLSLDDFRRQSEETALGLLGLGLSRGDRVALFVESDVTFCLADMGCLLAGLVDVPIYLTHAPDQVQYVIDHCGAKVLFTSDAAALRHLAGILPALPALRYVVVADLAPEALLPALPRGLQVLSLDALRTLGRQHLEREPGAPRRLLARIDPHDLATVLYTSGTTGLPKGVMLSHENISHNALTAFSGLPDFQPGPDGEVSISFLPLTHIFARTLHYGFVYHGTSVYFSTPDDLRTDLRRVRPTVFATVPRVLEKVYGSILKRITEMKGAKKKLANWSLRLGGQYEIGRPPRGFYRLQLGLADRLVFRKWREALGGRTKYIIAGGAALSPDLANLFAAAGIQILQGYGLTETSPVITYNRPRLNRAGTVGVPIPGVEVRIADDGEILTRGPHVMLGYFRDEARTREVMDDEGWFHTGDVGEVTDEGFLRITDRKKDLFKLSTGKYVTPQVLENRLTAHPLVEQAIVVGSGFKYCTALIFVEADAVRVFARARGLDADVPLEQLLAEPVVRARFQQLVDDANDGLDPWSTIKKFALIPEHLNIESGLLTPTMKVRRSAVRDHYADRIQALYEEGEQQQDFVTVEA